MVWARIHLHGRTPLHLVQGNLTGVRYRDEIVRRIVLPTLQAMGPGAILQDDSATSHHARVVTGFLQQHQVTQMDWLSCDSSFSRTGMPSLNRLW